MANRARRAPAAAAKRTLFALLVIVLALFGAIGATTQWANPKGQWTPKLGLDLEGGRQIVLQPVLGEGQSVNSGQVNQAVNIIRQRVDGTGVAEAEVNTLGGSSIQVAIPGNPSQRVLDSLSQSSKLTIRAVITQTQAQTDQQEQVQPTLPSPPSAAPSTTSSAAKSSAPASASPTGANAVVPNAIAPKAATETATATPSATGTASASPKSSARATGGSGSATPSAPPTELPGTPPPGVPQAPGQGSGKPTSPSDVAWGMQPVADYWVKAKLAKKGDTYGDLLQAMQCTPKDGKPSATAEKWRETSSQAPSNIPTVACDEEGVAGFLLGPAEVEGEMISDASSGQVTNQQGQTTGEVAVNLTFDGAGREAFKKMTTRLYSMPQPQNQGAIVIDGRVISAPSMRQPIVNGEAQITGGFTTDSAKTLADQLKYGALPFSFQEMTSDQISPQLGTDQLQKGIVAGLIGLLLVAVYSLLQYRALGFVTIFSLVMAGLLSYGAVTFLGFANNFRLTMAGITGLIVSIGITADSFIVYFERVRDEVRSGRALNAAVQTGWARAKRTIIISDAVSLLSAIVLYVLSEASVKAFAFTLGVTTIIDLIVVMMFTHPVLTLLARTKFFGGGHSWSGFDPERLGASGITYAGRGRVTGTIADRKAASQGGTL